MNTRCVNADLLSAALGELDEQIFSEAYLTDSADKMNALLREERRTKMRSVLSARNLQRVGAIAACCAAAVAIVISVPYMVRFAKQALNLEDLQVVPPYADTDTPPADTITIDGIGKLNYYSARSMLESALGTLNGEAQKIVKTLSSNSSKSLSFSSDDVFTVSEVSFLKLEVAEGSFLASKIGAGTVEAVVTSNNVADMMTFKNGDRFYSCAAAVGTDSFYSANSVEGFSVSFGDLESGYRFDLIYSDHKVTGISCTALEGSFDDTVVLNAIDESALTLTGNASFTVSSVEDFVNGVSDTAVIGTSDNTDKDEEGNEDLSGLYVPDPSELGSKIPLSEAHLYKWYNSARPDFYITVYEISSTLAKGRINFGYVEMSIRISTNSTGSFFELVDGTECELIAYENVLLVIKNGKEYYFNKKANETVLSYAGTFGDAQKGEGRVEFPDIDDFDATYVAKWSSVRYGEYELLLDSTDNEFVYIFKTFDGALSGTVELFDEKIYINVEKSSVPKVLVGAYTFDTQEAK